MKSELSILVHKYLNSSISKEELARLISMIRPNEDLHELEEMITSELKRYRPEEPGDAEMKSLIFDKLETQINAWERSRSAIVIAPKWFSNNRWRPLAAACVIIMLAGGSFFFFRKNPPEVKAVAKTVTVKDTRIAPGTNKAVLTLADGSEIMLDDSNKGDIAVQGGVKVIKLDNGILAYNGSDAAGKMMYNTISTPRGGQYQIVLPDGTRAWLNSSSSLRFPASFAGPKREVFLTGEGYFEVAPNVAQPFFVKAGNTSVNVLGTSFNVMAYGDEPELNTTLVDGSVQIDYKGNLHGLRPGEQAHLDMKSGKMGVVNANVEEVTAWKNGKFRFGRSNIKTIMRQMSRWYDVEIEYKGDVSAIQLSGILSRKENASDLLDALEETGDVHFKIEGKRIVVAPGAVK